MSVEDIRQLRLALEKLADAIETEDKAIFRRFVRNMSEFWRSRGYRQGDEIGKPSGNRRMVKVSRKKPAPGKSTLPAQLQDPKFVDMLFESTRDGGWDAYDDLDTVTLLQVAELNDADIPNFRERLDRGGSDRAEAIEELRRAQAAHSEKLKNELGIGDGPLTPEARKRIDERNARQERAHDWDAGLADLIGEEVDQTIDRALGEEDNPNADARMALDMFRNDMPPDVLHYVEAMVEDGATLDMIADYIYSLADADPDNEAMEHLADAFTSFDEEWFGDGEEKAITPGGRIGDASSRDMSPKKNWVEKAGGLPRYMRMVRNALLRDGHSMSSAHRLAIGVVKKWARGGGDVSPKVQAAAVKAVAEWEAKRARAHTKSVLRRARNMVYWGPRGYSPGQRIEAKPDPPQVARPGDSGTQVSRAARTKTTRVMQTVEELAVQTELQDVKWDRVVEGGGTGTITHVVTFEDGSKAIHKILASTEEARAELLTSRIGRAVGGPFPAVMYDIDDEDHRAVWMSFLPGESGASLRANQSPSASHRPVLDNYGAVLIGLVDSLTMNWDRNDGNWMLEEGSKDGPYGIDNSESFFYPGLTGFDEHGNEVALPDWSTPSIRGRNNRGPFAGLFATPRSQVMDLDTNQLHTEEEIGPIAGRPRYALVGKWIDNPLTPGDVDAIEPALMALQAEFKAEHQENWHEEMMARWAQIRRHAIGADYEDRMYEVWENR